MIDQAIQDLITKSLPKIHADELTLRLQKVSDLEDELIKLNQALDNIIRERDNYRDQANSLTKNLRAHEAIDIRETAVYIREKKIDIDLLTHQVKMLTEAKDDIKSLVATVFRNKHITYHTSGNIPVKDNNGHVSSHASSHTTTISEG